MKDLTIIVPLIEYKEEYKSFYTNAITSILRGDVNEEVSIIFVGPNSSLKEVKEYGYGARDVLFLENSKNVDLTFQINKAVKDVKTEYFSILEFDDQFTDFWFTEVEKYIKYEENTSLFLPLIELMGFNKEDDGLNAVGYANEPVWSSSFSDELGVVDEGSLKNHYNFIVSGGVFKKNDFLSVGGLKNSLKVFFWYELLLRLCHNGKRIFVIPKVGYTHIINRENTLTSEYQKLDTKELDFWFNTAQEEYVYKTDRKKTYNPNEE